MDLSQGCVHYAAAAEVGRGRRERSVGAAIGGGLDGGGVTTVGGAIEADLHLVPVSAADKSVKERGEERMLKGTQRTVGEHLLEWCGRFGRCGWTEARRLEKRLEGGVVAVLAEVLEDEAGGGGVAVEVVAPCDAIDERGIADAGEGDVPVEKL
ncbi:hypothetical protein L1887_48924 [Cichorium endivia]|nr:hypothetical protein L1887_48924 [Cichorium endivia]